MSGSALRAVLDPDTRSAAVARRVVEGALAKADLTHLLDEALLLVTELVTNAVVHAGTLVDLEVETDETGVRIEVADGGPGRVSVQGAPEETREGGRGLFLLDALATAWGTSSSPGRKAVWFRLGNLPVLVPPPATSLAAGPRRDPSFLTGLPPDFERQIGPARVVEELLRRLAEGLGRERGWVLAAPPDGRDWTLCAACDDWPPPDPGAISRGGVPGHDAVAFYDGGGAPCGAVVVPGDPLDEDDRALARLVAERIGVILREESNRAAQARARGSLAVLAEAGEMFAGTLDVRLAATLAARLVVPRLAGWAAVWTTYGWTSHGQGAVLQAVAHADESREDDLRAGLASGAGEELVAQLLERAPGMPMTRLPAGLVPFSDCALPGCEVVLLPLVARRRVLGLLVACLPQGARDEAGLLIDLARMAALAVDNARLYEERSLVADALQVSLLPPTLPVVPGLEFGARYAAAGESSDVGGDFYDVFDLSDGGWGVAIGDVCGKGAPAAAITGIAREVLRLLSRDGAAPRYALRRLNEALLGLGERSRFCTAVLGNVLVDEPPFRGATVRFSAAGHPLPVHLTAAGEARFVGGTGMLLGVLADVELCDDTVELALGDSLVFYTDGLTERRPARAGGDMFGEANLLESLRGCAGRTASEIAGALEAAAHRFDGGADARDDLAVLVVRAI